MRFPHIAFFLHLLVPLELVSQNLGTLLEPPFFGMKTTPLVPSRPNQSIKNLGNKLPHIGVNKYFSSFQNAKSKANKTATTKIIHEMKYLHPEAIFPLKPKNLEKHVFLLFLTHIPSHHSHRFIPDSVLRISLWSYGTILNGLTELFIHGLSLQVDTSLEGKRYLECFPKDVFSYKLKETLRKKRFQEWNRRNGTISSLTWAERRLCLLGDLAKQVTLDSSATVSR